MVLGGAALGDDRAQVGAQLRVELGARLVGGGQALVGEEAGLDALGQVDLLLGGEQLGPADAVEVRADQVGGDATLVLGRHRVLVEVRLVEVDLDLAVPPCARCLVVSTSCRLPADLTAPSRLALCVVTRMRIARGRVKSW